MSLANPGNFPLVFFYEIEFKYEVYEVLIKSVVPRNNRT